MEGRRSSEGRQEGGRSNVGNYYFSHQEKKEQEQEQNEEQEGTLSDVENGNLVVDVEERRLLHYSTEDIHLLATQVVTGYTAGVTIIYIMRPCKIWAPYSGH